MNSESGFDSLLEELYTEVQLAATPKKARRSPNPAFPRAADAGAALRALFIQPENWVRGRSLILFHDDTQSTLGVFVEYIHASVEHCRKLVRETGLTATSDISGFEHCSGDWWIGKDRVPEPDKPWFEERMALLRLHLADIGIWAPLVEVRARVEHGGIRRVELVADTLFADADGRELVTIPKGTNVLPVMTLDDKLLLRREIGL